MKKIYCDICKNEIENANNVKIVAQKNPYKKGYKTFCRVIKNVHVCDNCANELLDQIVKYGIECIKLTAATKEK